MNEAMQLVVEPATLEVMVGMASDDLTLQATLAIEGEPEVVTRAGAFISHRAVV